MEREMCIKFMLGRESEEKKNKQQIFMATIVKIARKRHIKHAKNFFQFFSCIHSNGHKHCLRQSVEIVSQAEAGAINIYDDY